MSVAIAETQSARVPSASQALTPMDMIDRALSSGAGIDVLERLMALQERYQASEARKAFNLAVAAAKREIPVIAKVKKVDFTSQKGRTNYDYEDLGEIARTVDPILSRHGLNYRFRTAQTEGGMITVTCILSHEKGHFEENSLSAGRDDSGNKNNIQAVGSTQTYLQRYTLKAALGLAAAKDDDGASPDATSTITPAQYDQLSKWLDEVDGDPDKFAERMKVSSLMVLPSGRYAAAVSAIQDRARTIGVTLSEAV